MGKIRLFNSNSRHLEEFTSIAPKHVKMYCCGPTVYAFAHIGNMRAYITQDLLRRVLQDAGYTVEHVMNITDVGHLTSDSDLGEDKILQTAKQQNSSVENIVSKFSAAFFLDCKRLHILRPSVICKATEHIAQMIDFIAKIEQAGFTYFHNGNLYFDTAKYPEYSKLFNSIAKSNLESRVGLDTSKKNQRDFVLWFSSSKFENQIMRWDSPWGYGYPGWHIECSAMATAYLGPSFDIHCGGADHLSIHHRNEIAQSQAIFAHEWCHYWIHNEFLLSKDKKMSKSSGRFYTLSDLLELGFSAFDYRYFLFTGHYRSQLNFSLEALEAAKKARHKLQARLGELRPEKSNLSNPELESLVKIRNYLYNDLDTPKVLAELWNSIKSADLEAHKKLEIAKLVDELLQIGLFATESRDNQFITKVESLIKERAECRQAKDFTRADELRLELLRLGIEIKDSNTGTTWEYL